MSQNSIDEIIIDTTVPLFNQCQLSSNNLIIPLLLPITAKDINLNITVLDQENTIVCSNLTNETILTCTLTSLPINSGFISLLSINGTFTEEQFFYKQFSNQPTINIKQDISLINFEPSQKTIIDYDEHNKSSITLTSTSVIQGTIYLFKYTNSDTANRKDYYLNCNKTDELQIDCTYTISTLPPGIYTVNLTNGCSKPVIEEKDAFIAIYASIYDRSNNHTNTSPALTFNRKEAIISFPLNLSAAVTRCYGNFTYNTSFISEYSCIQNTTPNKKVECSSKQLENGKYNLQTVICDGNEIRDIQNIGNEIIVERFIDILKQKRIQSLENNRSGILEISLAKIIPLPSVYAGEIKSRAISIESPINLTPNCSLSTENNIICNLYASAFPKRIQPYPIYIQNDSTIENTGILLYTYKRLFTENNTTTKGSLLSISIINFSFLIFIL